MRVKQELALEENKKINCFLKYLQARQAAPNRLNMFHV